MTAFLGMRLIISGTGGQGVVFLTRFLAETAIEAGHHVITSETHGMAQRGGVVISHLKIGPFPSPLIIPGTADGLVLLAAENLLRHRHFLRDGGWVLLNGAPPPGCAGDVIAVDADAAAGTAGLERSSNLVLAGALLAAIPGLPFSRRDCLSVLERRFGRDVSKLATAAKALDLGMSAATGSAG